MACTRDGTVRVVITHDLHIGTEDPLPRDSFAGCQLLAVILGRRWGLPEVWITLSGASGPNRFALLRRSSHRRGGDSPGVRPDSPVGAHSCWCSDRIASRERRCGAWIGHASTSALTRSEVDPGSIVIATGCAKDQPGRYAPDLPSPHAWLWRRDRSWNRAPRLATPSARPVRLDSAPPALAVARAVVAGRRRTRRKPRW